MTSTAKLPWDYIGAPTSPGEGVPNVPGPEGRALGAELARFAKVELDKLKAEFGPATCLTPCGECAFVAGTVPNGCLPTVANAFKCVVEGKPFYCHRNLDGSGDSQRPCAGFLALSIASEDAMKRTTSQ